MMPSKQCWDIYSQEQLCEATPGSGMLQDFSAGPGHSGCNSRSHASQRPGLRFSHQPGAECAVVVEHRFSPLDEPHRRAEAAAAVADLLTAAAAPDRSGLRGGGGGARPAANAGPRRPSADGAAAAEAVSRLHELYAGADPPPVDVVRHPRVRHTSVLYVFYLGNNDTCLAASYRWGGAAAPAVRRPWVAHSVLGRTI